MSTSSAPDNTPRGSFSDQGTNFFQALFDFEFNHFVTPKLVRVVYVVGMVLIGLLTLGMLVYAIEMMRFSSIMGLLWLIATPLLAIIYLAFFRMMLELYYAVVRLSEDVHHRGTSGSGGGTNL
ncbi:DUF4282 domain-containing protein [Ornithinimicrobium sp. Y1847]|uniref:DUF4282 domain-containing protein n=1 Tax=unclassified Ornithinimicrobium TaxID=2615080 RepID=UPI003B68291F